METKQQRYERSAKGKATQKRYQQSVRGKEVRRAAFARWYVSGGRHTVNMKALNERIARYEEELKAHGDA